MSNNNYGQLYVVATPIGNLADFSYRALEILQQVDLIVAEDTRHTKKLLQHYAISNQLISLHQHNEDQQAPKLILKLQQGLNIALVSDAGTPLLSDPGMPLVTLAQQAEIKVSPIPGACALIAALSVAGLPMNRFSFMGFLARTSHARTEFFQQQLLQEATWGFYESCHRIVACLQDMAKVFPLEHEIVVARELTKLHETVVRNSLKQVLSQVISDPNMQKGEFVVLVAGMKIITNSQQLTAAQLHILQVLLKECSVKTAVALAVEITGAKKKLLYQTALELK